MDSVAFADHFLGAFWGTLSVPQFRRALSHKATLSRMRKQLLLSKNSPSRSALQRRHAHSTRKIGVMNWANVIARSYGSARKWRWEN